MTVLEGEKTALLDSERETALLKGKKATILEGEKTALLNSEKEGEKWPYQKVRNGLHPQTD